MADKIAFVDGSVMLHLCQHIENNADMNLKKHTQVMEGGYWLSFILNREREAIK